MKRIAWNKGNTEWVSEKHRKAISMAAVKANTGRFGPAKGRCWKGGRVSDKHGYILVRIYEPHPRKNKLGYVREHLLVMEKSIGRPVERNEVVHHKNGITNDNRIENLELLSRSEHAKRIHAYKFHSLVRCPKCSHEFLPPDPSSLNGKNNKDYLKCRGKN